MIRDARRREALKKLGYSDAYLNGLNPQTADKLVRNTTYAHDGRLPGLPPRSDYIAGEWYVAQQPVMLHCPKCSRAWKPAYGTLSVAETLPEPEATASPQGKYYWQWANHGWLAQWTCATCQRTRLFTHSLLWVARHGEKGWRHL
jgi:hypothetical protein